MNFKENESEQKLRGGYYTPNKITEYLAEWVLENKPSSILEPSCGDGSFFKALSVHDTSYVDSVKGIELLKEESDKASKSIKKVNASKKEVINSDFFTWYSENSDTAKFDSILGNPPYIRYQYFDKDQRKSAEEIYKSHGLKFTKRTNAWVPFVIASVSMLNPEGRIAMVLPTELLYIHHAKELRSFLERELEHLVIVNFSEIVFEGTLQGTVMLMGKKRKTDSATKTSFKVIDVKNEFCLDTLCLDELNQPEYWDNSLSADENWMYRFLKDDEASLLSKVVGLSNVHQFKDIAKIDIGIVTGANSYFVVDDETVSEYDLGEITHPMLAKSDLIKGISYKDSDHEINSEKGKNVHFVEFPKGKKITNKKWKEYIKKGEDESLHTRYKCRIREPWWEVPYIWTSSIGLLKRCYLYPRLVLNEAEAYSTDTAYRIRLPENSKIRPSDFVYSFINTVTFIFSELNGRSYGGGVLELVPSDIQKLFIPIIKTKKAEFSKLDKMIRNKEPFSKILEYSDQIILKEGLGLKSSEVKKLRKLHERLLLRRLRTDDNSVLQ